MQECEIACTTNGFFLGVWSYYEGYAEAAGLLHTDLRRKCILYDQIIFEQKRFAVLFIGGVQNTIVNLVDATTSARARSFKCKLLMKHSTSFGRITYCIVRKYCMTWKYSHDWHIISNQHCLAPLNAHILVNATYVLFSLWHALTALLKQWCCKLLILEALELWNADTGLSHEHDWLVPSDESNPGRPRKFQGWPDNSWEIRCRHGHLHRWDYWHPGRTGNWCPRPRRARTVRHVRITSQYSNEHILVSVCQSSCLKH